ncbi:hypothetical protein J0J30_22070, partial [Vibrio vulnificus]|nr:hypothetical protein [Vibrio vulnificus]
LGGCGMSHLGGQQGKQIGKTLTRRNTPLACLLSHRISDASKISIVMHRFRQKFFFLVGPIGPLRSKIFGKIFFANQALVLLGDSCGLYLSRIALLIHENKDRTVDNTPLDPRFGTRCKFFGNMLCRLSWFGDKLDLL